MATSRPASLLLCLLRRTLLLPFACHLGYRGLVRPVCNLELWPAHALRDAELTEQRTTSFPLLLLPLLLLQDGWRTAGGGFADAYLGLKIARVVRVARLLVTISFLVTGPSLAYDHSRCVSEREGERRCRIVHFGTENLVFLLT